jgi:DNA-directed RNA polymerase specialized sigma24 family protein
MTAHEYLSQVNYLDKKIKYDLAELENLRALSTSISAFNLGERVKTSKSSTAPFVNALERVWEAEERLNAEVAQLVALKEEIKAVIEQVQNEDYRLLLLYKYISGKSFDDIELDLHVSKSTIKRWHREALDQVAMLKGFEE